MPGGDDNVWIFQPDLQRRFVALDRPADRAIAERHIGPDDPAQNTGHDCAAQDRFHGRGLYP